METIHIGVISHRHGDNYYASRTQEGLYKQLAEYCRDWWEEQCSGIECPQDDSEAIETYFGEAEGEEFYNVATTELE